MGSMSFTKPGCRSTPLEPGFDVRVLREVDLGIAGAVHVGVEGDVRDGVVAARDELAAIGKPAVEGRHGVVAACHPVLVHLRHLFVAA